MSNYICKIADLNEIIKKWDYEISIHPNEDKWVIWKNESIKSYNDNDELCYIGIVNGEIISEATAMLTPKGVQNADGLVDDDAAYLCAFRTRKEFQEQGYFSKLYKYMENDLHNKGYKTLTLGVEPNDVKNREIYFKYGFTSFIKSAFEIYPDGEKILVNYYSKNIQGRKMEETILGNVMVDCDDELKLQKFYGELLGWEMCELFARPAVRSSNGVVFLFIEEEGYIPPVWPEEEGRQQKQMHFDFQVEDVNAAVKKAISLGGTKAPNQYGGEHFVTMFDPAVHPFCLCKK